MTSAAKEAATPATQPANIPRKKGRLRVYSRLPPTFKTANFTNRAGKMLKTGMRTGRVVPLVVNPRGWSGHHRQQHLRP